ncbi:MAG: hypothetical protein Q9M94_06775 [Candidatus Gracilibacteria bacterium]|nr:hypothetical protein [Candidatus Gracilibacteria bacterium]MDQ7022783.1 hypothetical protein [Candidatus Gracilibacteria bacterium]
MKNIINPFFSLNRKESSNIAKVMNGELKTTIAKSALKKIFTEGQKLKNKIKY